MCEGRVKMSSDGIHLFELSRECLEGAVEAWLESEGRACLDGVTPVEWVISHVEHGIYRGQDGAVYMVIRRWLGKLNEETGEFETVALPKDYLGELVRAAARKRDGR